jgi:dephospho-CoA kinase
MKRIGILGDIGSGKTYVAKNFNYPAFHADDEVGKLYKTNRKIFKKLKKALPEYISSFPIDKKQILEAILSKKQNLKKIIAIIHLEIRNKLNIFLSKHKNKKFVILDIPLLLENKINKKKDILIFVQSKKSDILKRLKKRKNFNKELFDRFKRIQLSLDYKRKKSHFIIKNNYTKKYVKLNINQILKKIA